VIYSSNLFTYYAKYFQTLSGEKWRSFADSLHSMLKLGSTVHEVAWQFYNWPTVLDWYLFGHFYNCF